MLATRFVVAGFPRTGSSLTVLSLAKHPGITCFGELFHPDPSQRFPAGTPSGDSRWLDENEDAIEFLERSIWRQDDGAREVVGFKLFTGHTRFPGTQNLFLRLSARFPELRVIHCRRRNYLDAWVSLRKAEATGIWGVWPGREDIDAEAPSIAPEPRHVEAAFRSMKASDELLSTFHHKHRYLCVDYNELSLRFDATLSSMHRFLGVDPLRIEPALLKQNFAAHRSYLSNYAELAAHFKGTEFEWFFRE
jgi:LPS sulfotransferase NodH